MRNPKLVKNFYKSVAEHLSDEDLKLIHITTKVDEIIRKYTNENKIIFVTGHPGDGKTHLIKKITEIEGNNVEVEYDANVGYNKIKNNISEAIKKNKPYIVAINEGVLSRLLEELKDEQWYEEIKKQLFSPLIYQENESFNEDVKCIVIDLRFRNNLSKEIGKNILDKLIDLSECGSECPGQKCSVYKNRKALSNEKIQERIFYLLEKVYQNEYHATFRDILSFYSYLIFGETTCEQQQIRVEQYPYYINAFNRGLGPLFDVVNNFDPINFSYYEIDKTIWKNPIESDWFEEIREQGANKHKNPQKKRIEFEKLKRRSFFEHTKGDKILQLSGTRDTKQLIKYIDNPKANISNLIRQINRIYGEERETKNLTLWQTQRFNCDKHRFAIAIDNNSISLKDLRILVPKLNSLSSDAFEGYFADHVMLIYENHDNISKLRVDRSLINALENIEKGQTLHFRKSEPTLRVSNFIDSLSNHFKNQEHSTVDIKIANIEKRRLLNYTIDFDEKQFEIFQ